ncbi:prolipoprotein diacylglyceryl transferase [Candidatus Parcubacteria bacterium]|jgi:phosphatidylglycerol:prolipoprotein diacylglycerol transferase|nr:prolipoprotein diacylglyceryl transferase [Candidatus Parcubacteria bacterium]MBT7227989.1 prolipoprotein diacylglyceryl transferase [Candidatus Parcubacteria bacterium]
MELFWQNYLPSPILLNIGPFEVRWYGLILVSAIVLAAWYVRKQLLAKNILSAKQFEDFVFWTIVLSLVGARFGHVVFFEWDYYSYYPENIIKIWQGGISIQGALLFGLLTVIFWAKKNKVNFWKLADNIVPAVALGQAIGRWGNYFNQELFGKPTDGWWGIPIGQANRVQGYVGYQYFHPTFFYESILNITFFLILHKLLKKKIKTGLLLLIYLGGYSFIRFLMEFVRIDDTAVVWGIRLPQLISLGVIAVVIYFIFRLYKKPPRA